jgi:small subunit ribosomal protein S17e
VKGTTKKLLDRNPERFNTDFNHNKKEVDTLLIVPSKVLRNKIAGYITHLMAIRSF